MLAAVSRMSLVASLLLLSQGCDRSHSVDRKVAIPNLPARTQVEVALREVPGVQRVTSEWTEGSDHIPYERYTYHGERFRDRDGDMGGVVEIRSNKEGGGTLHIYLSWLNHTPSRQVIDSFRAGMDEVYASLRKHVDGLPPASRVQETLYGIPQK
jgi:hypothetical protein